MDDVSETILYYNMGQQVRTAAKRYIYVTYSDWADRQGVDEQPENTETSRWPEGI